MASRWDGSVRGYPGAGTHFLPTLLGITSSKSIWLHRRGTPLNYHPNGKEWRRTNRFDGNGYSGGGALG